MRLATFFILALVCEYRVGCDCGGGELGPSRCEEGLDAGSVDAGMPDAGSGDAGLVDAGALDAGDLDAGDLDAGDLDAGPSDAGTPDAGSPFMISSTTLVDAGSLSFVELEVDWARHLAFLGSRGAGVCLDVVDFTDSSAPVLVHTLGNAGVSGCLGVRLFGTGLLAVSANATNNLQVWDLTANPRNFSAWTLLADEPLGNQGKRFAAIEATDPGEWDLTLATRYSVRTLAFSSLDAGLYERARNVPSPAQFNDSAVLGPFVVAQAYPGTAEPVLQFDRDAGLADAGSTPTSFWGWTMSSNAARTAVFAGGQPGYAVLSLDGGALVKREYSTAAVNLSIYRGSTIVTEGTQDVAYAIFSDCQVDVFNLDDALNPVLVRSGRIPAGSFRTECYQVRVDPPSDTGIIVSNHGDFIVFRPSLIPAATFSYPLVP